MTKKSLGLLIVGLLVMAIAAVAWASDSKNYPGAMCVQADDGVGMDEDYWMNTDLGRANGSFYNESDSIMKAYCPMMADEKTFSSASIVVNNPDGEELTCRLFQHTVTGLMVGWMDEVTTTATGTVALTFDVSDEPTYNRPIHGILCFLPEHAKILRYYTYEDGGDLQ